MLLICVFSIVASTCIHLSLATAPSANPTASPSTVFSTACPAGWTTGVDSCLLLDSGDSDWFNCKIHCTSNGGYMPCIVSTAQTDVIRLTHPTTSALTWIGYNDIASEGNFVWDTGCVNSFTQWQANSPDNLQNAEDCAALYSVDNKWVDVSCGATYGCSCEKQFTSTGNACPVGWTLSEDGTYCMYFENTASTYSVCESTCAGKGATMLCIRNAADNAFLWKLRAGRATWLGYNRATTGVYHWPAGCVSSYTTWFGTEPQGRSLEDYAVQWSAYGGSWADLDNDPVPSGINCACQKPAYLRTVAPTPQPSAIPSFGPTAVPTMVPTVPPTAVPTIVPTAAPTVTPSVSPSAIPSVGPSVAPTMVPSVNPSALPSVIPSATPSMLPTESPTAAPSIVPTTSPTEAPSMHPTEAPTISPSTQPSVTPTMDPSALPTAAPTLAPSCAPSMAPTSFLSVIMSSPTYRVTNAHAFAAIGSDGSVHTWGDESSGGDCTNVQAEWSANVTRIVSARGAFAAVKSDGETVCCGYNCEMHTNDVIHPHVTSLVANEGAFAGVVAGTGAVYAFGTVHDYGGAVSSDALCNGYATQLSSGVVSIVAAGGSFAALKADGTVYTWGKYNGGGVSSETMPELVGVSKVFANREAYAAVLSTGRVLTWGSPTGGGDSSAVASQLVSGVIHIIASKSVFVAVKVTGGLVVWGYPQWGGDASSVQAQLNSDVTYVAHTFTAFAAIKIDGSVVTWGKNDGGGDSSAVHSQLVDIVTVYGNSKAFVAINGAGGVVAWGRAAYGGQISSNKASALSSGVVSIYHTDRAFAAMKNDGTVVVWGQAGHGGSPGAVVEALLISGVHTICSTAAAFSAIKTDGSVVGWGHSISIPSTGVLFTSSAFQGNVTCAL